MIGGGDTALDDALYLSEICQKVYLIHRRNTFRGAAVTLSALRQKENVAIITNAQAASIQGTEHVTGITLESGTQLCVDAVFIAVGMRPQTETVKEVAALDAHGYIVADETGVTGVPGFFAAGDVRTKTLRQVVTAAADGANAAYSALEYLRKGVFR